MRYKYSRKKLFLPLIFLPITLSSHTCFADADTNILIVDQSKEGFQVKDHFHATDPPNSFFISNTNDTSPPSELHIENLDGIEPPKFAGVYFNGKNSGPHSVKVVLSSCTVNSLYGSCSFKDDLKSDCSNNYILIQPQSIVLKELHGGHSSKGTADYNTIEIQNGTFEKTSIVGGSALTGTSASHNTIKIYNGNFGGYIYGGRSNKAEENIISIYGGTFTSSFLLNGGSNSASKGNTLNLYSPISIGEIKNFQYYNFYIPATAHNNTVMIHVYGHKTIIDGKTKDPTYVRAGVMAGSQLKTGDQIILIKNDNGISAKNVEYGTLTEGVSIDYSTEIKLNEDNTELIATIKKESKVPPPVVEPPKPTDNPSSTPQPTQPTPSSQTSQPTKQEKNSIHPTQQKPQAQPTSEISSTPPKTQSQPVKPISSTQKEQKNQPNTSSKTASQKILEKQRQKELERKRQEELEKKRQQELERQRQENREKKRQQELERKRQEELEKKRQQELERQEELKRRASLKLKDVTKSLIETRAASIGILNNGTHLLVTQGIANATEAASIEEHPIRRPTETAFHIAGFTPFAAVGANKLRYHSGSYVDTKGMAAAIGFSRQIHYKNSTLLIAPFAECGSASYDSYLDDGTHGEGGQQFYSVGILAKNSLRNGIYYEGSICAGKIKGDYSGILDGIYTKYDTSSNYLGIHAGIGKLFHISPKCTLDAYGKFFYTLIGSDTPHLLTGETYDFDAIRSCRLRLGTRLTQTIAENQSIYAGLAWDYEFDGEANASYRGLSTLSPSLKGGSAMLELGWNFKANKKSSLSTQLGLTAWAGKQEGIDFHAAFCWNF